MEKKSENNKVGERAQEGTKNMVQTLLPKKEKKKFLAVVMP